MPGKRKAKSAPGKLRAKSSSSARSRSRSPSGKKKGRTAKSAVVKATKPEVDILGPAAMQNLYYIAHTPVDALEMRGFRWPDAPKGKKGKKGKKKKK